MLAPSEKSRFDPKSFLAKAGKDRTIASYKKNSPIFSQGGPADAVFYIRKSKVKITVLSKRGVQSFRFHPKHTGKDRA